ANQADELKPAKPASGIVGNSAAAASRFGDVTARPRTLPSRARAKVFVMLPNVIFTWPLITSGITCCTPRHGTCRVSSGAIDLTNSPARCWVVPAPGDANVSLPGSALARSASSVGVLALMSLLTTSKFALEQSCVTGAKSLSGSNPNLAYMYL